MTGIRAGGIEFPLEASLSSLDSDQGTLVTAVLRDVSELHVARAERQAREALEAANRAKTEFLSRMSHELRTPLNAVLGFSQLLRLDADRPLARVQLERLEHVENAGAHLLALVNDVLDLSRVESGKMAVILMPVDVGVVAEEALSMVLPLAKEAGVSAHVDGIGAQTIVGEAGAVGVGNVLADRVRLRQVLVNLISNAIKYNRRGGTVRVSWSLRGGKCEIRIVDNGLGMTPDKLSRLFEPFNRLGAEDSKVEGTGIGLFLSRRLAELMQGDLRVQSTAGEGTVATLLLHTSQEPAVNPAKLPPPSQHSVLDQALHVLYAEDNEVNVELVRQIVSLRPSIRLEVAESGACALEKARRDVPELMLVDMNLGDMTGLQLASALRSQPATAGIRLVALSADALPEQVNAALAAGFEGYLTKPINFRELLDVLDG